MSLSINLNRISRNRFKRKAYISLISGFGNNLFQIAAAKKMESEGYVVRFDLSAAKTREFEFRRIPELEEYYSERVAKWTKYLPSPIGKNAKFSKFFLSYFLNLKPWIDLSPSGNLPTKLSQNYFIVGYWQRSEIANHLPRCKSLNLINKKFRIAIHVRRGDMIGNVLRPMDSYFRACLNVLKNDNTAMGLPVFVYTDDPDYCKSELKLGVNFAVVEGGSTIDDFYELFSSSHLILSRSTFSWWAAYFSHASVLCPFNWDASGQVDDTEIIPTQWNRVVDNPPTNQSS